VVKKSPKSKFKKEVLDHGAEACLPVNLSDEWIHYLDNELRSLDGISDDENENQSCALLAVVKILHAKNGGGSLFIDIMNELYQKLKEYRIEIALETVRRRTEIKYEVATINNIFTNRSVVCLKTQ
jgi:hypothetical protein